MPKIRVRCASLSSSFLRTRWTDFFTSCAINIVAITTMKADSSVPSVDCTPPIVKTGKDAILCNSSNDLLHHLGLFTIIILFILILITSATSYMFSYQKVSRPDRRQPGVLVSVVLPIVLLLFHFTTAAAPWVHSLAAYTRQLSWMILNNGQVLSTRSINVPCWIFHEKRMVLSKAIR